MSFNEGDIVKVVNAQPFHSGVEGKTGTVLSVNAVSHSCRVDLEWDAPEGSRFEKQGVLGTYLFTELELVKAIDQEEQVERIAKALYTEGNLSETMDSLREIAVGLYRAGVRHHG